MRFVRIAALLAGGASYVALALIWLGRERARDSATFPPASIYNHGPEGCAQAYRYLRWACASRGCEARVLDQPIGWQRVERDAVVLRLRPKPPRPRVEDVETQEADPQANAPQARAAAKPLLAPRDERWVRDGGRLVLGLDQDRGNVRLGTPDASAKAMKVFPIWPGVARIDPPKPRAFENDPASEGHALFTAGARPLVWRRPLGRGEILLMSAPEALENRALAEADHLELLLALVGSKRAIYFDEEAHGLGRRESLLGLMLRWRLGPSLALVGMAFGLLLWRRRVPTGAREDPPPPRRSEAVDLVDSMAQLYDRVLTRGEALKRYARAFERAVAHRTGLSGLALERRVETLLGAETAAASRRAEIGSAELGRALARINAAFRRLEEHAHTRRSR